MSDHSTIPAATEDIRKSAAAWIASADLKATAMLAAACAVPALAALTGIRPTNTISIGMLLAFCLLDAASIVASALVLFPRTNRAEILKEKGVVDPLSRSVSFFGDISSFGHYELKTLLDTNYSEKIREKDALEQTLIITWIANRKMQYMRSSVALLAAASVVLVAMSFVALTQPQQQSQQPQPRPTTQVR